MGPLRYFTLTGVDEKTDWNRLRLLADEHPFVEYGLLYSPERAGKDKRYPSLQFIADIAASAHDEGIPVAIHLCGKGNEEAFSGGSALLDEALSHAGRVQLNLPASAFAEERANELQGGLQRLGGRTEAKLILQWNEKRAQMCSRLRHHGVEFLVDGSGGRGIVPAAWPMKDRMGLPGSAVGYAGGLAPDNLREQLPRIHAAANGFTYWIDMESRLRSAEDDFDVGICERVVRLVAELGREHELQAGARFSEGMVKVNDLDEFWLNWWASAAAGHDMNLPPENASRPTYIDRIEGRHQGITPLAEANLALRIMEPHGIGFEPERDGTWTAWPAPVSHATSEVIGKGKTMAEAGLRAMLIKKYGPELPRNPATLVSRYAAHGELPKDDVAAAPRMAGERS